MAKFLCQTEILNKLGFKYSYLTQYLRRYQDYTKESNEYNIKADLEAIHRLKLQFFQKFKKSMKIVK